MPDDNEILLRDILSRLETLPTRHEFQNLVNELKDFVTKSEFNAYKEGIESRLANQAALCDATKRDVESLKSQRLPQWALTAIFCILSLGGTIWTATQHNQPAPQQTAATYQTHK